MHASLDGFETCLHVDSRKILSRRLPAQPVAVDMTLSQMTVTLASDLLRWSTSHALLGGLAAFAGAIASGLVKRAWGFLLLAAGTFCATVLAVWEYDATGAMFLPALVLVGGVLLSGLLGWLVHPVGLVGTVAFSAAGWYLVLYAFLGHFLSQSIPWDLVWIVLFVGSTYAVHRATRMIQARRRVALPQAPESTSE